ncbi:hypothetical protein ABE957_12110 [Halomonas sp. CS7]|uniref:Lipoprotein n=1 Tax=Halomonas pelophila TaxID=3151122 RepID=A0ABV1N6T2_9GAMM
MNSSRAAGGVMLLAGALLLAGCSYTPPRILSEPLIEIDGDHGGYHRRHERRYYHDGDRHDYRYHEGHDHDRHHYHDGRRDRDRHHHRQRSRFCPPGLAMQGRC